VPSSEGDSGAGAQDKKSNVSGGARVKTIPDDDLGLPEVCSYTAFIVYDYQRRSRWVISAEARFDFAACITRFNFLRYESNIMFLKS
jgi:hypothetical protein